MNLYFIYKSRNFLDVFCLVIALRTCSHFLYKESFHALPPAKTATTTTTKQKLAVVADVVQNMQKLVISRCCSAENRYEMYQDLKRACRAIVGDVLFAVTVAVCLS